VVSILPDLSQPVVATRLWYHVGAANEEPRTRGFAHLFEHVMFGGTASHDKRDYWAHHHRFGGDNNAFTSWDETSYVSDIPPAGFPGVLELEADRMVNLRLDQENLDNEKRIVTEELRLGAENDPFARVFTEAVKRIYGDHPYSILPWGTKEDIVAATLDHTRDFYARYYRPRNAHLVVVGPVDGPATLAAVQQIFGPLPAAGETPADVPALEGWKYPELVRLKEDLPPAEIAVLFYPLPPPNAPDDPAVTVLTEMLTAGQVNPFREDLVTRRRKALEAGSMVTMLRRGGSIYFFSAVLPYRREAGQFRVMRESLRRMSGLEWLTDETLAGVKRRILRRVELRAYSAAEMADNLVQNRWWRGDAGETFARADRLASVTRADVAAAFDRYIARATPVRIYVQPRKVPVAVRLLGWLIGPML